MGEKSEQIKNGLIYAKNLLDTVTVSGAENCQKISAIYNNLAITIAMLENGEIVLADGETKDTSKNTENI